MNYSNQNALSPLTDYVAADIVPENVRTEIMDGLVRLEELFYKASLPCPETPANSNLRVPEVFTTTATHKITRSGQDVFIGEVSAAVRYFQEWGGDLKLNAKIV